MTPLRKTRLFLMLFASLLLALTLAGAQGLPAARFLIVSDLGGKASTDQKAVAAAMGKEAERINAQFVVTAGDNFHENGIDLATSPRWKSEFEDVYSATSLQIPWYPSIGNHEYAGNVDAEIEYSALSTRWKFPSRYYAHHETIDDSTSILIVHLDTAPFVAAYYSDSSNYHVKGQDTKRQLVWLDSTLTVSHDRWKIVVGHHPVYSAASKHGNTDELIEQVLPILKKFHVPLYACGHDHILQHLKRGSMEFVICGGGAKHRETGQREDVVFGAGSLGFVSVTATAKEMRLDFLDAGNTLLHTFTIVPPNPAR